MWGPLSSCLGFCSFLFKLHCGIHLRPWLVGTCPTPKEAGLPDLWVRIWACKTLSSGPGFVGPHLRDLGNSVLFSEALISESSSFRSWVFRILSPTPVPPRPAPHSQALRPRMGLGERGQAGRLKGQRSHGLPGAAA